METSATSHREQDQVEELRRDGVLALLLQIVNVGSKKCIRRDSYSRQPSARNEIAGPSGRLKRLEIADSEKRRIPAGRFQVQCAHY